ncbi:hypothetical protein Taro_032193, partial [Colocasia esculenta]|nr:hypothetical protein [Colocasia esculenta]
MGADKCPPPGALRVRSERSNVRRIFGSLLELARALNQWPLSTGKAMVAFMGQPSIGLCWPICELTPVVLTPSASRPTNDFVGLVSSSGDVSRVDAINFKTYRKLHRPGFIFWGRQLYRRHQLQDPRITLLALFHIQVTPVVLTSSASRPTNDFVGLVSYSSDVGCVDVNSFKTYGKLRWPGFIFWGRQLYRRHQLQDPRITMLAWFHIQVTPVVLTSSASRPMNDFVGLVSYSSDAGCVDVTPVVLTSSASRPMNDFVGLVSYSGDASCVDAISFKAHERLRWPASTFQAPPMVHTLAAGQDAFQILFANLDRIFLVRRALASHAK